MSNLIITIISIGLVAIAAIMGIYYGGQAYSNAQINAIANSIINESQQILQAERLWAVNNNQPDISGMANSTTANGVTTPGINGGFSALVNGKMLEVWPPFAGTIGGGQFTYGTGTFSAGPAPNTGQTSTGSSDYGCYSINGYVGKMQRALSAYNSANYVAYTFASNITPTNGQNCNFITGSFQSSTTDISQTNHPIVQIAKAINAKLNQIPSNATTTGMAYIGLPNLPSGSSLLSGFLYVDSNNVVQTNYCYVGGSGITCVFGPS